MINNFDILFCDECGSELEDDNCHYCEELEILPGSTCEYCDKPAEYLINGEYACADCHENAYPID